VSDRIDTAIAALVLAAVGLILIAPVLGRNGATLCADAVMLTGAIAGVGAFALAAVATLRAARRPGAERGKEEPS
jgi:hypothetical protein